MYLLIILIENDRVFPIDFNKLIINFRFECKIFWTLK